MKKLAVLLGLRKKTLFEKVKDVNAGKVLLYTGLAAAGIYGLQKAAPMMAGMAMKKKFW